MKSTPTGLLFILSGPAGAGKSTLASRLCTDFKNCVLSISATTRNPRTQEKQGQDYFFYSKEEFNQAITANKFAEYAEFSGNYYGTLKKQLNENLTRNLHTILDIEVKGAALIKNAYPQTIMIFILPPTPEILSQRLTARGTENQAEVKRRLAIARKEVKELTNYDYLLYNNDREQAVTQLKNIYLAECSRIRGNELNKWLFNRSPEEVIKLTQDCPKDG